MSTQKLLARFTLCLAFAGLVALPLAGCPVDGPHADECTDLTAKQFCFKQCELDLKGNCICVQTAEELGDCKENPTCACFIKASGNAVSGYASRFSCPALDGGATTEDVQLVEDLCSP